MIRSELIEMIRAELHSSPAAYEALDDLVSELAELESVNKKAQGIYDAMLVRAQTLKAERDQMRPIIAALAVYGEGVNLRALVAKARDLNEAPL